MDIWVSKLVTKVQTGRELLSCAYTTQLLHSTVEVCWNNDEACQEFRGQVVPQIEAVHNLREVRMYLNVLSLRSTS